MNENENTKAEQPQEVDASDLTHLLNANGCSIEEAAKAFQKLWEVARKVKFPDLVEIRRIRLQKIKDLYGLSRFIMPEYYRWLIGI